jgi:hypothetical protein
MDLKFFKKLFEICDSKTLFEKMGNWRYPSPVIAAEMLLG